MTFSWTSTSLLLSLLTLLVAAGCCWISWQRSHYSRSVGLLECLRFVIVLLVVLTLNQPEIRQEFRSQDQPTLVVLYDTSQSMQTEDVLSADGSSQNLQSRTKAIQPLLAPASEAQTSAAGSTSKQSETKPETTETMENLDSQQNPPVMNELWKPARDKMQVRFEPFSSQLAQPEQGTDLNQALKQLPEQYPNLRGVVLLSDGDWNTGESPSRAATSLRMKNIPVFPVGIGSEERLPDIELVSVDAPTFGVANKAIQIPFQVVNWLPRDRDLRVTLTGTRGEQIQKMIRVPGLGQLRDTVSWTPEKTGEYQLSLAVPVDEEEINKQNNQVDFPITINQESLKVLVVESYPRWEYRYLRNALERDPGVEVSCLLFHPDLKSVGGGRGYLEQFPNEQELFKYDVVFLGDVGCEAGQMTLDNCQALRQLVRSHAGGLVFLPGFRGKQESLLTTELEELYPVLSDAAQPRGVGLSHPSRFALTESGRRSLLTRLEAEEQANEQIWRTLPGFQWYASATRAKIGSEVLAIHDSESTAYGRIPLIVTRTAGTGKILFMGTDGAWRWRKGVEDLYHYRFWSQVVRWMAYQRNMSQGESMRLFYSPDRPQADYVLTLNANVMSRTGEPLREGTVTVQITTPTGQVESVRLKSAGEESWGLFTGSFTPKTGGSYQLVTRCAETGAQLETLISVQGSVQERIGQPARFDVLQEIADLTRGRLTTLAEMETIVQKIAQIPEPEPLIRRFRIWSHPLWGGLIVGLLTLFWIGRKWAGLA